jgi:hypothetical protein
MHVLESVHAPPVALNVWQVAAQYAFGPQDTMAVQLWSIALKAVHTPSQKAPSTQSEESAQLFPMAIFGPQVNVPRLHASVEAQD